MNKLAKTQPRQPREIGLNTILKTIRITPKISGDFASSVMGKYLGTENYRNFFARMVFHMLPGGKEKEEQKAKSEVVHHTHVYNRYVRVYQTVHSAPVYHFRYLKENTTNYENRVHPVLQIIDGHAEIKNIKKELSTVRGELKREQVSNEILKKEIRQERLSAEELRREIERERISTVEVQRDIEREFLNSEILREGIERELQSETVREGIDREQLKTESVQKIIAEQTEKLRELRSQIMGQSEGRIEDNADAGTIYNELVEYILQKQGVSESLDGLKELTPKELTPKVLDRILEESEPQDADVIRQLIDSHSILQQVYNEAGIINAGGSDRQVAEYYDSDVNLTYNISEISGDKKKETETVREGVERELQSEIVREGIDREQLKTESVQKIIAEQTEKLRELRSQIMGQSEDRIEDNADAGTIYNEPVEHILHKEGVSESLDGLKELTPKEPASKELTPKELDRIPEESGETDVIRELVASDSVLQQINNEAGITNAGGSDRQVAEYYDSDVNLTYNISEISGDKKKETETVREGKERKLQTKIIREGVEHKIQTETIREGAERKLESETVREGVERELQAETIREGVERELRAETVWEGIDREQLRTENIQEKIAEQTEKLWELRSQIMGQGEERIEDNAASGTLYNESVERIFHKEGVSESPEGLKELTPKELTPEESGEADVIRELVALDSVLQQINNEAGITNIGGYDSQVAEYYDSDVNLTYNISEIPGDKKKETGTNRDGKEHKLQTETVREGADRELRTETIREGKDRELQSETIRDGVVERELQSEIVWEGIDREQLRTENIQEKIAEQTEKLLKLRSQIMEQNGERIEDSSASGTLYNEPVEHILQNQDVGESLDGLKELTPKEPASKELTPKELDRIPEESKPGETDVIRELVASDSVLQQINNETGIINIGGDAGQVAEYYDSDVNLTYNISGDKKKASKDRSMRPDGQTGEGQKVLTEVIRESTGTQIPSSNTAESSAQVLGSSNTAESSAQVPGSSIMAESSAQVPGSSAMAESSMPVQVDAEDFTKEPKPSSPLRSLARMGEPAVAEGMRHEPDGTDVAEGMRHEYERTDVIRDLTSIQNTTLRNVDSLTLNVNATDEPQEIVQYYDSNLNLVYYTLPDGTRVEADQSGARGNTIISESRGNTIMNLPIPSADEPGDKSSIPSNVKERVLIRNIMHYLHGNSKMLTEYHNLLSFFGNDKSWQTLAEMTDFPSDQSVRNTGQLKFRHILGRPVRILRGGKQASILRGGKQVNIPTLRVLLRHFNIRQTRDINRVFEIGNAGGKEIFFRKGNAERIYATDRSAGRDEWAGTPDRSTGEAEWMETPNLTYEIELTDTETWLDTPELGYARREQEWFDTPEPEYAKPGEAHSYDREPAMRLRDQAVKQDHLADSNLSIRRSYRNLVQRQISTENKEMITRLMKRISAVEEQQEIGESEFANAAETVRRLQDELLLQRENVERLTRENQNLAADLKAQKEQKLSDTRLVELFDNSGHLDRQRYGMTDLY